VGADVVHGAELHGGDGQVLRSRVGHDDDRELRPRGPQRAHDVEPGQIGQLELGDDARDARGRQRGQRAGQTSDGRDHGVVLDGADGVAQPRRRGGIRIDQQHV
jgi:hypothetical protein